MRTECWNLRECRETERLRALHAEMEQAVASASGWPALVNGEVIHSPTSALNPQPPAARPGPRLPRHQPRRAPHPQRAPPAGGFVQLRRD